ncbi:hypothetical protein BY458DRAFT_508150 [Sporodiniella umbellata]|nr:hypothetical protein BY458DRAFT_508150 [Sporodiniella umbellata]
MNSYALIFGATGAVGKQVLTDVLKNGKYEKVVCVGRREVELDSSIPQEKLIQKKIDFDNLEKHREDFKGIKDVFCCLGTTRADAGSADKFIKIDQEYVLKSAKMIAEENTVEGSSTSNVHYIYCSSMGADKSSLFLYPKSKGQTEEGLKHMGFKKLTIFRPGFLEVAEPRSKAKFMESLSVSVCKTFERFLSVPLVNPVTVVGQAMHRAAQDPTIKPLNYDSIKTSSTGTICSTFERDDIKVIGTPSF